jgi:hypothetical protein
MSRKDRKAYKRKELEEKKQWDRRSRLHVGRAPRATHERVLHPNRLVRCSTLAADRRGRRSAHARARVLPETHCMDTAKGLYAGDKTSASRMKEELQCSSH